MGSLGTSGELPAGAGAQQRPGAPRRWLWVCREAPPALAALSCWPSGALVPSLGLGSAGSQQQGPAVRVLSVALFLPELPERRWRGL